MLFLIFVFERKVNPMPELIAHDRTVVMRMREKPGKEIPPVVITYGVLDWPVCFYEYFICCFLLQPNVEGLVLLI